MTIRAITCKDCGGAVMALAGQPVPRCAFCGSPAITVAELLEEQAEPPKVFIDFAVDPDAAGAAFRKFASASIWYPGDLRRAHLELRPILLPAWYWSGTVETHYAALVPGATRSGKTPSTGVETLDIAGVLVLASTAITRGELSAIAPYHSDAILDFDADSAVAPYELGRLTRSVARDAGHAELESKHRLVIGGRIAAYRINTTSLVTGLTGDPMLLPVYIGAYRRKDKLYRVVINGQTGKLTGKAPLSWARIGCAIFLVLGIILFLFAVFGVASVAGQYL